MAKISPCSRRELIKKLKLLGFDGPFGGGKHSYMKKGNYRQIIPNPHKSDIDSDLDLEKNKHERFFRREINRK